MGFFVIHEATLSLFRAFSIKKFHTVFALTDRPAQSFKAALGSDKTISPWPYRNANFNFGSRTFYLSHSNLTVVPPGAQCNSVNMNAVPRCVFYLFKQKKKTTGYANASRLFHELHRYGSPDLSSPLLKSDA